MHQHMSIAHMKLPTLQVPAMPLNLKRPKLHTSMGTLLVGKSLPDEKASFQTKLARRLPPVSRLEAIATVQRTRYHAEAMILSALVVDVSFIYNSCSGLTAKLVCVGLMPMWEQFGGANLCNLCHSFIFVACLLRVGSLVSIAERVVMANGSGQAVWAIYVAVFIRWSSLLQCAHTE